MKFKEYIAEGHEPDIHYSLENIKDKVKFYKDCISKSYKVRVDELFNNIARQSSKSTPDDVFKIVKNKKSFTQYRFIIRKMIFDKGVPYIEVGLVTSLPHEKEYFLFIYIKLEKLDYFIKKYKLMEGYE